MGVRRRLGRRHLPVRSRRAAPVRQGIRGDLLQGKENSTRRLDARLGPATRPARCCTLGFLNENEKK